MKNMNGDELYDWMAALDCLHVASLHQMPSSMGDVVCARLTGAQRRCESCGQGRRTVDRRAEDPWRTVTYAGLWDWARWEQARDERWRREHARALGHAMGWCPCEPASLCMLGCIYVRDNLAAGRRCGRFRPCRARRRRHPRGRQPGT